MKFLLIQGQAYTSNLKTIPFKERDIVKFIQQFGDGLSESTLRISFGKVLEKNNETITLNTGTLEQVLLGKGSIENIPFDDHLTSINLVPQAEIQTLKKIIEKK